MQINYTLDKGLSSGWAHGRRHCVIPADGSCFVCGKLLNNDQKGAGWLTMMPLVHLLDDGERPIIVFILCGSECERQFRAMGEHISALIAIGVMKLSEFYHATKSPEEIELLPNWDDWIERLQEVKYPHDKTLS